MSAHPTFLVTTAEVVKVVILRLHRLSRIVVGGPNFELGCEGNSPQWCIEKFISRAVVEVGWGGRGIEND